MTDVITYPLAFCQIHLPSLAGDGNHGGHENICYDGDTNESVEQSYEVNNSTQRSVPAAFIQQG